MQFLRIELRFPIKRQEPVHFRRDVPELRVAYTDEDSLRNAPQASTGLIDVSLS